jgi:transcriptional regulator with XRE-family HTH domain
MEIGERIEAAAKAYGYSLNAFSINVHLTVSATHAVVKGRTKPSFDMLQKIATFLPNLSMEWLLRESGPMLLAPSGSDPACWDLLKREEEQHEKLKQDYAALKGLLRQSRIDHVLLQHVDKNFVSDAPGA